MTYRVTLTNCLAITDSSKRQAEGAFQQGLEAHLGTGPAGVALAFAAYKAAIQRHGGEPLPLSASAQDRDAVDGWNDAYAAGREAAFVGWVRPPESAHFEVIPQ